MKQPEDYKRPTAIRLERRLSRAAKVHSLEYKNNRLKNEGSAAWYMRQALIEKLIRDGFDPRKLEGCKKIYEISKKTCRT